MNHKRRRPRNRRAGCKMCKPWKINGVGKHTIKSEAFSDYKRREFQSRDLEEDLAVYFGFNGVEMAQEEKTYDIKKQKKTS